MNKYVHHIDLFDLSAETDGTRKGEALREETELKANKHFSPPSKIYANQSFSLNTPWTGL